MPTMERISMEEYNRRRIANQHFNQLQPVPLPIQSAPDVVLHDDDIDDSDDELGALAYKSSRTAKLREAEEIPSSEVPIIEEQVAKKSKNDVANYNSGSKSNNTFENSVAQLRDNFALAVAQMQREEDPDEEKQRSSPTGKMGGKKSHRELPTESQLFREEAEANNNELSRSNDTNITRSKRKSPQEVENTLVSSEPKESTKKKRKKYICSNEGCPNYVQTGGVCKRHGAKVNRCSHEECTNLVVKGGVCIRHGASQTKKSCSHEGCTHQVVKGGVCVRHGASWIKYFCSYEGCTNIVVKGGVCIRHGAKVKRCSHEGCTNHAKKGGVCIRHGAKVKTCSYEGCTNQVVKGRVCIRHGATVKTCKHEGCTNQVQKGGVCIRHGAKRKICSNEGCTSLARKGGVCMRHFALAVAHLSPPSSMSSNQQNKPNTSPKEIVESAPEEHTGRWTKESHEAFLASPVPKRKDPPEPEGDQRTKKKRNIYTCSNEGCTNQVQKGGVCIRHGASLTKKTCSYEGCTNQVRSGGVCKRHGAKNKKETCIDMRWIYHNHTLTICTIEGDIRPKRKSPHEVENTLVSSEPKERTKKKRKTCSTEGCTNHVKKGGVCMRHGAKQQRKTCKHEGCTNHAKKGGVCVRHGAKVKRCSAEGCTNKVQKGGVCIRHGASWTRKTCSHEGCTKYAKKGGVCIRHGAKVKTYTIEDEPIKL